MATETVRAPMRLAPAGSASRCAVGFGLQVVWLLVAILLWSLAASASAEELPPPSSVGEAPESERTDSEDATSRLAPIVVDDEAEADEPDDPTADTVLVDGERLQQSPRASLFEALAAESASVFVTSRGGGLHGVASGATGGIKVRGLGGSPNTQVVVVEDGVPDVQGIFGHPLADAYVPFLLRSVELIKGGDSVRHGANAMGAVLRLEGRWPTEPGTELRVATSGGSFATLQSDVAALGRHGALDWRAAVHAFASDGEREGAGGSRWVVQGATRLRLEGWELSFHEKLVHFAGADPGPIHHPVDGHDFDVLRNLASLRARSSGSDPLGWEAQLWSTVGVHRLYDGFRSEDWSSGGRAELTWQAPTWRLLGGLAFEHVDGDVSNIVSGEALAVEAQSHGGVYVEGELALWERLHLMAGARAHASWTWGFTWLAKAGAQLDLPAGFAFRGRFARNLRQPTLRELYLPFPVANPELQPELAHNLDGGITWSHEPLSLGLSLFRSAAEELIKSFGAWPSAELVNIDALSVWGIEAIARLSELGPLDVSVSYAWQDVGRFTRQNPEHKLDAQLGASIAFGDDLLRVELGSAWVGGLYQKDYHREPLDDVFLLDGSLRYRTSLPSFAAELELWLTLRNLLDGSAAYVEGYPMPRFNFTTGLSLAL